MAGSSLAMTSGDDADRPLPQSRVASYTSSMDREFLSELFAGFGPVTIRRMFSGFGISADGINFALVLRGAVYLRADENSIPRFESEGSKCFQYEMRGKLRMIGSYWQLPERLYDDPDEVTEWARVAHAAAIRASLAKASKKRATKKATKAKVVKKTVAKKKAAQKAAKKIQKKLRAE
ncbi:DNA transformation protein [Bradyrhizobium sp. NFR13]|uniref:TfoX/Sxy family protein n=1 Tax=Bradyrhizobium sp. NFR13 TaxID=1566285 RepID=UPI0008E7307F|nr:DNA transformation protein [Bradyrhizobium sp. NFR13]